MTTGQVFESLLDALGAAAGEVYGARLVSLAVFGSVGRRTARSDSDLDFVLVVDRLPNGRMARVDEFAAVEARLGPALARAKAAGVTTYLSPVFKTREEALRGSPLFLDLVDDARFVVDEGAFFAGVLDGLRAKLTALGARRIWHGTRWYWDLKPDFRPGDTVEL